MEMCQEKDEMIAKLQMALDQNIEAANEDVSFNVQHYLMVLF